MPLPLWCITWICSSSRTPFLTLTQWSVFFLKNALPSYMLLVHVSNNSRCQSARMLSGLLSSYFVPHHYRFVGLDAVKYPACSICVHAVLLRAHSCASSLLHHQACCPDFYHDVQPEHGRHELLAQINPAHGRQEALEAIAGSLVMGGE